MAERKAVIKSADMSEDMQQDAVDCASQALEKYNIEKVTYCLTDPITISLTLFLSRTLLLISRRSSIRNTTQHGIVLLGEILVLMSRTRPNILSIFI
jgi:hypothetical protein